MTLLLNMTLVELAYTWSKPYRSPAWLCGAFSIRKNTVLTYGILSYCVLLPIPIRQLLKLSCHGGITPGELFD